MALPFVLEFLYRLKVPEKALGGIYTQFGNHKPSKFRAPSSYLVYPALLQQVLSPSMTVSWNTIICTSSEMPKLVSLYLLYYNIYIQWHA